MGQRNIFQKKWNFCHRACFVTSNDILLVYEELGTIIRNNFCFFLFDFSYIPNQSRAHFRPWLRKFVFAYKIFCSNFVQIDNV